VQSNDRWRYTFYNGTWWYWLPEKQWVFWQDNRWNAYVPARIVERVYPEPSERIAERPSYIASRPGFMGGDEIGPFYGHALSRSY
jgi:hypothetical protein